MNLREEIDIELKKHLNKWKYVPTMMEVADITIKVIEKRIDELMNPYINMENRLPYYRGCVETLQEVKKMLKR